MKRLAAELEKRVRKQTDDSDRFLRVELRAPDVDPLAWLSAQPFSDKGYWSDRNSSVEIAAAGEADMIKGGSAGTRAGLFEAVRRNLDGTTGALRYYGGFRFSDQARVDLAWKPFGQYRFLLPRFELVRAAPGCVLACNFRASQIDAAVRDIHRLADAPARPAALAFSRLLKRKNEPAEKQWAKGVETVLHAIEAGDVEKVVLARRTTMDFIRRVEPLAVVRRLREELPGCFHFCGSHSGLVAFAGATPERLFRRDGNQLLTEALAGTRPRGEGATADSRLADELIASPKERAEHQLVVDGIREALAPLCESVASASAPDILKLANVQHLHTPIVAVLRPGVSEVELMSRLHPTPAVGGRPRAAAMKRIEQIEPFDRGWYCGPVGWVSRDASEFAVAIRCGLVLGPRLCLYAGAGIVPGSQAAEEWLELEGKIGGFLKILDRHE